MRIKPAAIMLMIRLDPPWEMKGRGTPVVGNNPRATLIWIKAWVKIRPVKPQHRKRPKLRV